MKHVEYDAAVKDFLAQDRVAVAGVSREGNAAANVVYRRLRAAGKKVYAVNPNADRVEDDPCYPDLSALPEPVDGVVIATAPAAGRDLVQQCVDRHIPRVWFHRSFGTGSTSEAAAALGKAKGLQVISGGCPLMHCEPVDLAHRCMRWVLDHTGGLPDTCR